MKYIPNILIILLIVIILFFLFRMNKVMTIQTALLVGMAQKLGVAELPPPSKEEHEETVEESEMIAAIADKIFVRIIVSFFIYSFVSFAKKTTISIRNTIVDNIFELLITSWKGNKTKSPIG